MEKRYQVFVSSTYEDLQRPRQEVMTALLETDCIPAGMELFPATNDDQWTVIKNVIDECDYYIIIVAGRYGSVASGGLSFTEMEYDYAQSLDKPTLVFLYKDLGSLPSKYCESTEKNRLALERFRERLTKNRMCKFWTNADELGGLVSRAINVLKKTNPAVGWVRGDQLSSAEANQEILMLRRRIDELAEEIESVNAGPPPDVEGLSKGNDQFDLRAIAVVNDYLPLEHDEKYWSYDENRVPFTVPLTWDEIIRIIGPLLVVEKSEGSVKRKINDHIVRARTDESEFAIPFDKGKYSRRTLERVEIDPIDFNTILFQLQALGVIARKDAETRKAAEWKLTRYGERHMRSLFAVRRAANPSP